MRTQRSWKRRGPIGAVNLAGLIFRIEHLATSHEFDSSVRIRRRRLLQRKRENEALVKLADFLLSPAGRFEQVSQNQEREPPPVFHAKWRWRKWRKRKRRKKTFKELLKSLFPPDNADDIKMLMGVSA